MVYLSIQTLKSARGFTNPCQKRELDLRDLSLDRLENLGLTMDQYDVIDISSNYIKRLENFPTLNRLECIVAHNNVISAIDSEVMSRNLPSLRVLLLTNNNISDISELTGLSKCKTIEHLSLLGNPVTGISDYRSIVIAALPFLRTLDHKKVTLSEKRVAEGKADGLISSPIAVSGHEKDKTPAQNRNSSESAKGEAKAGGIDKKLLQKAIGLASTPEMLAALEKALKSGTFNADFVKSMGNSANDSTESISEVQQETEIKAESSKEAEIEELNRTDLMKMSKADLINLAKKYKVSEAGTKATLCDNILKAYEPEKANCNESMKRKREDNGESDSIGATQKKAKH
eukprot:g11875.t1